MSGKDGSKIIDFINSRNQQSHNVQRNLETETATTVYNPIQTRAKIFATLANLVELEEMMEEERRKLESFLQAQRESF